MAQPQSVPADLEQPLATLIDNRPGNTMLEAIRRLMIKGKSLDIATGYFEVGAMVDLDTHWQGLEPIRVLMGDETSRSTRSALVQALESRQNGIEDAKEIDDWHALDGLAAVKAAIAANYIQTRIYTKDKFHAKAYHFKTGDVVNHGLIGSSNFTRPGLTRNLELNLFTSDNAQLAELAKWYEKAWDEAEDIREELLRIIEPHVREYRPFEVYLQAMRERFFGLEAEESTWEKTDSVIYPILAQYQKDAYYDLKHMADTWGGALLCDGVGLGKTFVGLMLVEYFLRHRQRILIVAPKAAIPSVWNRNLARFFPDDFNADRDYQHDIRVRAMTDFGGDEERGMTLAEFRFLKERADVIIVDEAHHFRVPNRNRSKKLRELCKGKKLFMLTATPVNNSLLDLYNLLDYIALGRSDHFQSVNVPRLRNWFTEQIDERQLDQPPLETFESPTFQEFLRHVLVSRSRRYVKSLDLQMDASVKFPIREKPEVINYSLSATYGALLPRLFDAFDSKRGKLKLVIYETEQYKEENQRDSSVLAEQSQVVALIRTMLLKRLESSQVALLASIEDLLLKHVVLAKQLHRAAFETWFLGNAELYELIEQHRRERLALKGDEEDDELPLTTYESKKINQVKADIESFGPNKPAWLDGLATDMEILASLLRGLYEVTHPENDAKLKAFVDRLQSTPRLTNDKFVLFTEFKDTARYLEIELNKVLPMDTIVEVDSGRNVANREQIIKRFAPHYNCEDDEDLLRALAEPIRILVSTDVLSEGLNLQDANVIVNYDLHWNPVRLMQRIGRVDRRMDPSKPVDYDRVYVYNFLPPKELDDVLGLYSSLTRKLIYINRALGIEAPVLTAEDDFKAMDFYQNLGEGTLSVVEQLRLKSHELAKLHPELWNETLTFPNRIYSGKDSPRPSGGEGSGGEGHAPPLPPAGEGVRSSGEGESGKSSIVNRQSSIPKYLFLCYRIVTGYDPENPDAEPIRDAKWVMIDRETGDITEDLMKMHEAIECAEGATRKVDTAKEDRTKLRKQVEGDLIEQIRFRSQIPMDYKDELVCWMEVG